MLQICNLSKNTEVAPWSTPLTRRNRDHRGGEDERAHRECERNGNEDQRHEIDSERDPPAGRYGRVDRSEDLAALARMKIDPRDRRTDSTPIPARQPLGELKIEVERYLR